EYSLGRSSGQYTPNNPYHNIGGTVADTVGDAFQSRYIPQQATVGTSQYYTSPTFRPLPTMDDQSFGTGLSQETTLKIEELKRLVYKYRQYQNNDPDEIVRWAVYWCINGDNTLLIDKLEQLRKIDSRLNGCLQR
ncbi:MAG: hypothetical protein WBZ36_22120, partial [Candidatus Nitrosopolaris sp.]